LNLTSDCTLQRLSHLTNLHLFDCGKPDLNEFLKDDAINYASELLGVTYLFTLDSNPNEISCFLTVSNDALRIDHFPNKIRRKINKEIPHAKQMRSYPAVKIGRLGVDLKYKGVGSPLMDFIKGWFSSNNKTGCRFLLVDAYNEPDVLKYYQKNDFQFLLEEEDEIQKDRDGNPKPLRTRLMFFDLIHLTPAN
jgi:hypothetical protein